MKNIFMFFALVVLITFTACNKLELDDIIADEGSTTSPINHLAGNNDLGNEVHALFTIENEDNTLFERDALLLTNSSINAVSFKWDFGNGDTSSEAVPSYKYNMHGNYNISLAVTDTYGNTHKTSHEILVLCLIGGGPHYQ